LLLKIGPSEFRECSEEDVRRLLPIQACSQKQLSVVGTRQDELNRFVRSSIEQQLADLKGEENDLKAILKNSYNIIHVKRILQTQIHQENLELESLSGQAKSLREQLVGLTEEDREVIASHEAITKEEQFVRSLDRGVESI
jgi:type III restriction enzyme